MLTLAIEASNPSAADSRSGPGVAAGIVTPERVEVLAVEPLRSAARHDDDLMPAIDRLWPRIARPRADLQRIAVSLGPGGYTGLRIAVVTAKLIAESVGALCIGIPTARALARRAAPDLPRPFAVALASKGETTVITLFDSPDSPGSDPQVLDAPALAALSPAALIADHHLPAPMRDHCARRAIRIDPPRFDPVALLELSALIPPTDPLHLAPLYIREPEAVRKWRELHG